MTKRVPSDQIESIVGTERHWTKHYARAVSAEQTVYILHSRECLTSGIDLRVCRFSLPLDRGIDVSQWAEDEPLHVHVRNGRLEPAREDA